MDAPSPVAPAVETQQLAVRRMGRAVLHDIDLRIPGGRITGLLGPSGAGKTTLIRAIVGEQRGVHGSVTVLGHPAGSTVLRASVATVPQDAAVYDDLTVVENLRYFARVQRLPAVRVDTVLATVGLEDARRRLVGSLSGGQRSRVSLGVALLGEPQLLVLDEPTVGLDPVLRARLWDTFRELADAGTTLLVSSHVMDEAARCDDLLLLRDGAVLAQTTPVDLLHSTGMTSYESAFLALVGERQPTVDGSRTCDDRGGVGDSRPPGAARHAKEP